MYQLENGWVQSVKQVPSPNYDLRPENIEISLLVIHGISLPPGIFDNEFVEEFFTNQLDHTKDPYFEQLINLKVSSHLYIKRSGEIIQFVSLDHRAWHAGLSEYNGRSNCNDFSIGIELEGTENIKYTNQQYMSLIELSKCCIHNYSKLTIDRIVGHSKISPGRKTDPGVLFDWQYFLNNLALKF
ncbi:MAG: 1,6-anhydro-N-acetylmuramyl-L-alanine amidase AmpD [Porticoccaceae bacterium]|nr:1,6-anhydro-N-acetylmuramyl-L-alanine amidase AmpD [Porticoccaceae bacterium]